MPTGQGGSRRFHHKSRNGCGQCKRRHIKCDLQPPICHNCKKKQLRCEYLELQYVDVWQHGNNNTPGTTAADGAQGSVTGPVSNLVVRENRRLGRGQYAMFTFRVNRTSHAVQSTSPLNSSLARYAAMSHYSTITRLDVPDSDRLVAHWYGFTAKTISVADVAARQAIGNLSMSFAPLMKDKDYIHSIVRGLASLHINYLRSSSTSHPASSPLDSIHEGLNTNLKNKKINSNSSASRSISTHPGQVLLGASSTGPEPPEVFEARKHLGIAISTFRAQVTAIDQTNWFPCAFFAIAVLVFRLDMARRAPAEAAEGGAHGLGQLQLQAAVIDPIRALRDTAAMGDQVVANLTKAHAGSARRREMQERQREAYAQVLSSAQQRHEFEEIIRNMDRLLRLVEYETGQKGVLPSFQPHLTSNSGGGGATGGGGTKGKRARQTSHSSGSEGKSSFLPLPDSRLQAAAALRAWTEHIAGRPRSWLHLMSSASWTSHLSEEFISLISARDPLALIITLYWLVIMNKAAKRWFMDGWAQKAGTILLMEVGPEWKDMLVWPQTELGLDFETDSDSSTY